MPRRLSQIVSECDRAGVELPIRPNGWMAGMKQAASMNGVVHLSPAMYSLVSTASDQELEHLLESIQVVELPHFDTLSSIERGI